MGLVIEKNAIICKHGDGLLYSIAKMQSQTSEVYFELNNIEKRFFKPLKNFYSLLKKKRMKNAAQSWKSDPAFLS